MTLSCQGDDEQLMKTIHLANVACGFHASYVSVTPIRYPNAAKNRFRDFQIMDKTVRLAKENNVLVGAHPSLPDRQGFGRREMVMDPVRYRYHAFINYRIRSERYGLTTRKNWRIASFTKSVRYAVS